MSRQQEISAFLKKAKIVRARLTWLPHDASGRRYARVQSGKKFYILMDSPANERPDLFYKIDKLLEKNKVKVPHIYQANLPKGLILMQDLGQKSLADIYNQKDANLTFLSYQKALNLLFQIKEKIIEKHEFIPNYSDGYFTFEENLLTDWYVPALTGKRLPMKAIFQFKKIWKKLNQKNSKNTQNDGTVGLSC